MSALDGVGGQRYAPAVLLPGKTPGTHCIVGWGGPGPVWTGAENLAPTRIRSPDRPARSESLYRLSYPGRITGNTAGELHQVKCDIRWRNMVEVKVSEEYGLMKPVFYSSQLTAFSLSKRDLVYHEAERNIA
jgi:hypothetical protein